MDIDARAVQVLNRLREQPHLSEYIDYTLPIPKPYCCDSQNVKLIILGQDPTVKNEKSRTRITTVLNLNKNGRLWNYLNDICSKLKLEIDKNIYATNVIKNFFTKPPTQIKERNIFKLVADEWIQLLLDELSQFKGIPIISLGQPILSILIKDNASKYVRDYWGYIKEWKKDKNEHFAFISEVQNNLDRKIFPFPHQPSKSKEFYTSQFENYIKFVKDKANI